MSKTERDKGLRGELEIKHIFGSRGWTMRGLEGQGDHIAMRAHSLRRIHARMKGYASLHVEAKRQERLALPAWLRQAEEEAPDGTMPVVVFRQNREQWYVCLSLADFLELVG